MPISLELIGQVLAALVVSFLIALILTPVVRNLAVKVGAVDVPKDNRRMHKRPIPLMGGLAIFLGFLLGALLFVPLNGQYRALLLGSVIIVVLGIFDDIYALKALPKLFVQIAAALVAVCSGNVIEALSNPNIFSSDPYWELGILKIPFTVLWIVAITNAVNLIDGLDGLADGVSSIGALTMLIISILLGEADIALICGALLGACVGFILQPEPRQDFYGGHRGHLSGLCAGGGVHPRAVQVLHHHLLCRPLPDAGPAHF